jgi:hypothetical protein
LGAGEYRTEHQRCGDSGSDDNYSHSSLAVPQIVFTK